MLLLVNRVDLGTIWVLDSGWVAGVGRIHIILATGSTEDKNIGNEHWYRVVGVER